MNLRARNARRRGFSLLEVMIALAILTVALTILVQTQSEAAHMTREAERVIVASDLARLKLDEALLRVEAEGFQLGDLYEDGDFSDLGDDALDVEYGRELEDYHWEYAVNELDVGMAGDVFGAMGQLQGEGVLGGGAGPAGGGAGDLAAAAGMAGDLGGGSEANAALGALGGISPDMIATMIGPYFREVRVRVWWGKDSEQAEKNGDEVVVTGHVINPSGVLAIAPEGAAGADAAQQGGSQ